MIRIVSLNKSAFVATMEWGFGVLGFWGGEREVSAHGPATTTPTQPGG